MSVMKKKAIIYSILALCSVLVVSCMAEAVHPPMESDVNYDKGKAFSFTITGSVYDVSSLQPLEGILVTVSAYDEKDSSKRNPVWTNTCLTNILGSYSLPVDCRNLTDYYDVTATDIDGEAGGGEYITAIGVDAIWWSNSIAVLEDQDIYMTKKD